MRIERWYWLFAFLALSLFINYGLLHNNVIGGFGPGWVRGESNVEVTFEPAPEPKVEKKAAKPEKPKPQPKPVVAKVVEPKRNVNAPLPATPKERTKRDPFVAKTLPNKDISNKQPLPYPAKVIVNEPVVTRPKAEPGGFDRLREEKPITSGLASGQRDAGVDRLIKRRNDIPGGGGAPAPDPNRTGKGGMPGPEKPPEDIVFNGGGRGGMKLDKGIAKLGGGGGNEILSIHDKTANPLAEAIREEKPGIGAGVGGGEGLGANGGVGYSRGRGIGTRIDGTKELATLRRAPGNGIGAGEGDKIGTNPPGGGRGTGAELPGTGGEGLGYGRGKGIGIGNGSGTGVGDGDGARIGRIRGIPFGDVTGLNHGDPNGGGGRGGGPGGPGRGAVFGTGPAGRGGAIHVVYCLDVSGSMVHGDKIGKAKEALIKSLMELKPQDTFDIITFSAVVDTYSPQMLPASAVNTLTARSWVQSAQMAGGTNLYDALKTALGMGNITTIYVITDGDPTVGEETEPTRIRARLRLLNGRRIQINAIGLYYKERPEAVELLTDIAKENDGLYRAVDIAKLRGD